MNITIQSVGFTASEHLQTFLNQKIAKIFKHSSNIIRVDVVLKKGAENNPFNEWCEITISLPGENPFVKKNSDTYEKSIIDAVEAMDKILRRRKRKERIALNPVVEINLEIPPSV